MKRLVEFQPGRGGSVSNKVDEPSVGVADAGFGRRVPSLVNEADRNFQDVTVAVTPPERNLVARLRSIDDWPNALGVESGVRLDAWTGAFAASLLVEMNSTVPVARRLPAAAT